MTAVVTAAASRLVKLENETARAFVYPEQGFQLHGFAAAVAGSDGDGNGVRMVDAIFAPGDGSEPADRRYGNPVLFPSAGITFGAEEARWTHGGRILPMQQHGWARDAYWHVEAIHAHSVTGLLVPTTGLRASFPFAFELRLRYALEGATLALAAELRNTGDQPFPYALGFHPYLRATGACRIRLPAGTRLTSADSWRTIDRAPAPARAIDASEPELPGSILLAGTGATALQVDDPAAGLATRVSVDGSEQSFPTWVIWNAGPGAPYVCLEPWTDAPNALNRPGTRTIAARQTHRYRMAIPVRALGAPAD